MAKLASTILKRNLTELRARYFTFHASVGANIDIAANGPEAGNNTANAEIHVLGAGNLAVKRLDGVDVTIVGVPAGYVMPASVKQILSAGTTATNIIIYY